MLNKDQKGLEALFDQFAPALMGIIIRIVKNRELAEELLQKTLLKVWNNIEGYDGAKGALFTWISTIARNVAIDEVRLDRFENLQKTDSLDSTVYELNSTKLSSDGIDVKRLLSTLDDKHKIVLDLVYLQGYSQSEAAKKLDIPLGTVKTRIRKALSNLRSELINEKTLFFGSIILMLLIMIFLIWL